MSGNRTARFHGTRTDTDPSDGQIWLGRFDAAIAAGKAAAEAAGVADEAALAFRERFATAARRSGAVTSKDATAIAARAAARQGA